MPILLTLLPVILPSLIKVAEKKFNGSGQGVVKKTWVLEFLSDAWDIAATRVKFLSRFNEVRDLALPIVASRIDSYVEKMKSKGAL